MCTTAFLGDISQYIQFGDVTSTPSTPDPDTFDDHGLRPTSFLTANDLINLSPESEPPLTRAEEDAMLRDTTASFADWVTSFIRR